MHGYDGRGCLRVGGAGMISKTLLFSENCPQPEISLQCTGNAVFYRQYFQTGILRDKLKDGLLSLRRSSRLSESKKPLYYVIFVSKKQGYSWVSKETDFDTAISTYRSVIFEEFI